MTVTPPDSPRITHATGPAPHPGTPTNPAGVPAGRSFREASDVPAVPPPTDPWGAQDHTEGWSSGSAPHIVPAGTRTTATPHGPVGSRPSPIPPAPRPGDDQEPAGDPDAATPSGRFLAKAALVTAGLSVAGALLGLVRDQALARLFGAGSEMDAFLVAWTVPEFAATLLIEEGLAFALIPAFSAALARRAQGGPGDPVRALVGATLPRLTLGFVATAVLLIVTAPHLVEALAPGLPHPALAVDCTRLTATCVLGFGLAGYCSAALRAHRRFLAPAAIYVAYNTGIITGMFALGGRWGVRSAAVGVAAGGCLMVAVQLPSLWRQLRRQAATVAVSAPDRARPMEFALVATVLLFALCRQSQVLIERFLASHLPAGAISHLNYAQKVAQMPMVLSLMLCTVTFPVVARALAEGDTERARVRVERDLSLAACIVLLGTAVVIACAPQIVELLFQRGAFTPRDSAATAGVMRVYALGLLGQTLVGVLVRSYFSAGRPTWYPVGAMTAGIVVTAWIGAFTVLTWGVDGIATANAAGITVTAALLLGGMGRGGIPIRTRRVLAELTKPLRAAVVATLAGAFVAHRIAAPVSALAAGCLTATTVFLLLGLALGAQGLDPALHSVRTVTRRLSHGR
ncbi:murein biosynthesis integral membrane protein MurJ [Streptomyces sp. SLBN-31]|uniref:murein biosynthesis integral membrane protein MurJ n=1 Tax=Streptomyces sp. SLBN-31 TaxID=2768444 RepID=UPI0011544A1C|nr:lipid II flippase MurJ [Streptomyces sp. SLBN-31]TQJ88242.1 putative peptidoglycan lipid II flippase [Streptomyces sp. SLBN-31]